MMGGMEANNYWKKIRGRLKRLILLMRKGDPAAQLFGIKRERERAMKGRPPSHRCPALPRGRGDKVDQKKNSQGKDLW